MTIEDSETEFYAAIRAAEEEAPTSSPMIGTEHLLLGILRQEQAKVVRLLATHGFTYKAVRRWYDTIFNRAAVSSVNSKPTLKQFSPKAAEALTAAQQAAGGQTNLAHLMAALLDQRDAVSRGILQAVAGEMGQPHFNFEKLSRQVDSLVREHDAAG